MPGALASLLGETLRWAWTRDESHQPTSRRKVLYFAVMYGSWLSVVVSAGIVFELVGNAEAAEGIWLFGVGFSIFMGVVDIAWEAINHLTAAREESGRAITLGGGGELSATLRIQDDTWIGFLVTFFALIGLMVSYAVATALMGF